MSNTYNYRHTPHIIDKDVYDLPFLQSYIAEQHELFEHSNANENNPYMKLLWAMLARAAYDLIGNIPHEKIDAAKWVTAPLHICEDSKGVKFLGLECWWLR